MGQLSTVKFLLVIVLGSAVGDARFYPDIPLLHAMVVVTIVVVANKALDTLIARSTRAEKAIDGEPRVVVRDGVLIRSFLESSTISSEELFQQLREMGSSSLVRYGGLTSTKAANLRSAGPSATDILACGANGGSTTEFRRTAVHWWVQRTRSLSARRYSRSVFLAPASPVTGSRPLQESGQ